MTWTSNGVPKVILVDPASGQPVSMTTNGDGTSNLNANASGVPGPTNFALETGGKLATAQADIATIKGLVGGCSGHNITDTADHLLLTGAGILRSVVLNTPATTSTLKVYDGTTAGGTLLATLDGTATARQIDFDITVATGIFAKATGTADWTVTWQ